MKTNDKLLYCDRNGVLQHCARGELVSLLRPGDLVIANDAATIPASMFGRHVPSGKPIEIRLASLTHEAMRFFSAIVFGAGDYRTRTEDRPPPPPLNAGDILEVGSLRGKVLRQLDHPRFIALEFEESPGKVWGALARYGHPIQYAHVENPLAIWDTWTPIAGRPVAVEPPSAGFALSWKMIQSFKGAGVGFSTLTHAAGISSTGDPVLDKLLPFDEPYRISTATAQLVNEALQDKRRIVAIGTTVVRALEHAFTGNVVPAGKGVATQKIGPATQLRVVNALVSGVHEPGTSHHDLIEAFTGPVVLNAMDEELAAHAYRNHEFGDSVFIEAGT